MPFYNKAISFLRHSLNQSTPHLMLDIEALGLTPGSAILQIGACIFHPYTGHISHKLEINIDIESSKSKGFTTDQSTLDWWEKQGGIPELPDTVSVETSIKILESWILKHQPKRLWAWGTTYDFPLLENIYQRLHWFHKSPIPWKYHSIRDARTLWDLAFPDNIHKQGPHTALEDCINQVQQVHLAYHKLGLIPCLILPEHLQLKLRRLFSTFTFGKK